MQLLQIHARPVAQFHVLEVVPASLIPRAQVRSVSWQRFHAHVFPSTAGQKLGNSAPSMNRRAVPDDQQACSRLTQQVLQEGHAVQTRQRLRTNQSVQFCRRCESCHHRQVIPTQPLVNNRRLPFRPIRSDHARQQVEARFIQKPGSGAPAMLAVAIAARPRLATVGSPIRPSGAHG